MIDMEKSLVKLGSRDWLLKTFSAVKHGAVRDCSGRRMRKEELLCFAQKINSYLGEKSKIAIWAENSINWLAVFMACVLYGRELYAFHKDLNEGELLKRLKAINPDVLITSKNISLPHNITTVSVDELEKITAQSNSCLDSNESLTSIILYTTGTTGSPKGVKLSLENVAYELFGLQNSFKIADNDRILLVSPFSHAMGFVMMLLALFFAKDAIIATSQFEAVNELICENVDVVALPPSMINTLKQSDRFVQAASRMKFIISGGAMAPGENSRMDFVKKKINVINGYGMTEAVAAIATEIPYDNKQDDYLTPLCCCEIKLSSENEVLVRGKNVAERYLDGSRIVDDDGWYHTRDLGITENGKIKILSRKDSIIVMSNGYKINLDSMENRICQVDGIMDARVFIEKNHETEYISAEIISSIEYKDSDSLLCTINSKLEYFEKIKNIYVVKELTLNGEKKKRGK